MKNLKRFNLIFLSILLITFLTPVHSFDFTLPDTGQELCYDWDSLMDDCPSAGEDFHGQDAHYTINPPDLTDNGDRTVTDNLTDLVWEQKTEESEQITYTYIDAVSYCENLSLGVFDDWRIPTRGEFSSILNLGTTSPALDTTYFPNYSSTSASVYYWTSSEYYDDPAQVWKVQVAFGVLEAILSSVPPYKVRCVRGATEPAASYTDNGNGTVTDGATKLMWEQKTQDGGSRDKDITYTWKDALAYCEGLILGERDDWRLPNPKEFERLVDLESSSPAVDTTYFPNTNNGLYWTGTTCSGCHKFKAFSYDFADGKLYFGIKFRDEVYYENYVRCIRTTNALNTTTTTATATTTTVSIQPCPLEEIYGKDSEEALLLRSFRDNILSKAPEGQEIIRLYYEWSSVIVTAMVEDAVFKQNVKEMIDGVLELIGGETE